MKRLCKQILARGTNWFLVALLSIALALTACSPTEQTPVDYVFDDLGRLVAINGTPQRIVSLAPSNTEILFALGLGDKVVGVTDWCNYPPEALEKEKVGGYVTPDIEKIVALNPDLILVAYGTPMEVINTMVGLGLTVFGIKTTDLDDVLNDIRTVGEITDKEVEAYALTSEMAVGIKAITDQTEELEQRPRVFYIVGHEPSLWTAGSGTFIHELIEKGGGVNTCQNITGYSEISIEYVLARDPEIIIASEWSYDWAINASELASTNASQTGRIYTLDDDLAQRPGPRLVEGLEWFAYFIHPEIFEEPEGS
ncbi:MAG TPA: ABC transporter substrate-binding protein [Dehalococcoidia bacterium]|nr:ABC transporter substrate-binding protein [Dehalococcoidia bacterium]